MEFDGEKFHLTEYQFKKTVKAFNYLDKKKTGFLKLDLLGDLMRCCGYNVSLGQIEIIKRLIVEGKKSGKETKNKNEEKDKMEDVEKERDGEGEGEGEGEEEGDRNRIADEETTEKETQNENELTTEVNTKEKSKKEVTKNECSKDDETNLSKLLSNLKNYDNFMEIEKKKEELKKKEEENKSLFSLKEYFRIIQTQDITKNIKPPAVLAAFEHFDKKGNGKISIKMFRFILQYLGEPFSNSEFDDFYTWITTLDNVCRDGYIIYEELLNELIDKDANI